MDFFPDDILEGGMPVAKRRPFFTVPFSNASITATLVVFTCKGDCGNKTFRIKVLDAFKPLAQLITCQRCSELFQCQTRCFNRNGHCGNTDVVIGTTYVFFGACTFASVDNLFHDFFYNGCLGAASRSFKFAYALGNVWTNCFHVGFCKPNDRMNLFGSNTVSDRIAHRYRLTTPRTPDNHIIGPIPTYFRPRGRLLITRTCVRKRSKIEFELFSQIFKYRYGLTTEGRVNVYMSDLLAFEPVALLVHVVDQKCSL